MDRATELHQKIENLHLTFGPTIPKYAFTDEVLTLLLEFKAVWLKINWLDDEVIWTIANIDRHNGNIFGTNATV